MARGTRIEERRRTAFGQFQNQENQFEALGQVASKAQDAFEVAKGHFDAVPKSP